MSGVRARRTERPPGAGSSVYQSDVIYYGADLADNLHTFWSDLADGDDLAYV